MRYAIWRELRFLYDSLWLACDPAIFSEVDLLGGFRRILRHGWRAWL